MNDEKDIIETVDSWERAKIKLEEEKIKKLLDIERKKANEIIDLKNRRWNFIETIINILGVVLGSLLGIGLVLVLPLYLMNEKNKEESEAYEKCVKEFEQINVCSNLHENNELFDKCVIKLGIENCESISKYNLRKKGML